MQRHQLGIAASGKCSVLLLSRGDVLKGALAATAPEQQLPLAAFAAQRCGGLDEESEDDRTIITRQLDQIGLGDQPA